jgi:hypothetical protein
LEDVAGLSLFVAAMQSMNDANIAVAVKDPRVWTAVLIGLIGLLAKDGNVTGGTVGQPSTTKALADANQAPAAGAAAPKE